MSSSLIPSLMAGNNMKIYERGSKFQSGKNVKSNSPTNTKNHNGSVASSGKNANELKSRQQNNTSEYLILISKLDFLSYRVVDRGEKDYVRFIKEV